MIPLRQRIADLLVGQQVTLNGDDVILRGKARLLHPRMLQHLVDGDALQRVATQEPLQQVTAVKDHTISRKGYINSGEIDAGYSISFATKSSKKDTRSGLNSGSFPTTMMYSVTPTAQICA